ncbi:MAG TPA: SLBB domain-containing protein [Pyrinomonadaceae bacterium]|nr:SLBB domain-containing protein [Pyrinomonadaceae bacterium]HMP64936.1 SLBB domain-containing protein [Pyrinomonadaceae bacterium]
MRKLFIPVAVVLFALPSLLIAQTEGTNGISPTRSAPGQDERYRIGFQDTLEIQVFRRPELTQRVSVAPNGTINLFRIPEPIIAVCKTERELANDITEAYQRDYLRNPEVSVVAVEQRSQAFGVLGAVDKPGYYFVNRPIRLLELLAMAGGQTDKAGSQIVVARTGSTANCRPDALQNQNDVEDDITVINFKLRDVLEARQSIVMQPGDIVNVMDADIVFVYGNVNKQGQVTMREPLTLTQAIASAEGLRPAASKNDVRILRQVQGSLERKEFVYDLRDIDRRRVPDPYLEPNDIVAVGEDRTKSILNSIGRSLTNGIPSVLYRFP